MSFTYLEDLLSGGSDETRPLPEAQCATLKEIFGAYSAPCPFRPGDLVTARKTCGQPDYLKGEPYIVLEVIKGDDRIEDGDDSFVRLLDMRVAVFFNSIYITPWVESFEFEPYVATED